MKIYCDPLNWPFVNKRFKKVAPLFKDVDIKDFIKKKVVKTQIDDATVKK